MTECVGLEGGCDVGLVVVVAGMEHVVRPEFGDEAVVQCQWPG